jgi:hypothetical protein
MNKFEEKRQEKLEAAKEAAEKNPFPNYNQLLFDDDKPVDPCKGTSVFHGTQRRDYQGKSYIEPPSYLKNTDHNCFIPKKWVHTWVGH